jgi:hypothetical protein
MKKETHIHKYKRITLSKRTGLQVFKCVAPICTHYVRRELAIGRVCICWKCGEELILNAENTQLAKPTHIECRGIKVGNVIGERRVVPKVIAKEMQLIAKGTKTDDIDKFLESMGLK